jgi:hypothetical protein
MDELLKPDSPDVLADLQRALDGADQCIGLAKREAARAEASLRTHSSGRGKIYEQALLDNAKRRREQLRSLDLRLELPPDPPRELPPADRVRAPGPEAGIPAEALLVE